MRYPLVPVAENRPAWAVVLAHCVLTQMVTFAIRPAISYRALELGLAPSLLGLFAAAFAITPMLTALLAGRAADLWGHRPVTRLGAMVLLAAVVFFVALGDTLPGLALATALLGTGFILSAIGPQTLIATRSAPDQLDHRFGLWTFAASAGQALGPGLIILFGGGGTEPSTERVFLASVPVALALLLFAFAMEGGGPVRGVLEDALPVRRMLRLPGLRLALATSTVVLVGADVLIVYLPALGVERGVSAGLVAWLLVVRAVASMASRLFMSRLTARWGRRPVLVGSLTVACVATAAVPLPLSFPLLLVLIALSGFGLGIGQPLSMSFLAQAVPTRARGRAISLRLTGNQAGQVFAMSGIGFVAAVLGSGGPLWLMSVVLGTTAMAARRTR